jgi:hypothetical protein
MRTTRGKKIFSRHETRRSTQLNALLERWFDACRIARRRVADLRGSRPSARPRQLADTHSLGPGAAHPDPGPAIPDPPRIEPNPATGGAAALQSELSSLPDDRAEALAALCDRLLQELSGPEVKAAEIRFVIHKHDRPTVPPMDPDADPGCGELAWELHRLIASAGGTLADVVHALDLRGPDLTERGRELLQDEVTTLDDDLSLLKAHLAGPTDWDAALECLLGGEIAPFDDLYPDEETETDD